MPHRDPTLAALMRNAQLRQRIAEIDPRVAGPEITPRDFAAARAEGVRLERVLARVLSTTRAETDVDNELAPHAFDIDDGELADAERKQVGRRPTSRERTAMVLLASVATVAGVGLIVAWAAAPEPTRAQGLAPTTETTLMLRGVVVTRHGRIRASGGEHCTITMNDSGDRDQGRQCRIYFVCPEVQEEFVSYSCPIGEPRGPVHLQMSGAEIDESMSKASFAAYERGVLQGGATLRLYKLPR